ncbi:pellicle/biofilm biosynthesis protein PelB [Halomonas sp. A020]|uniref:tetratricopeptide repeat protein n=1 Tax=Halomonas sp. A020 TaxID=2717374 RepID=UPI0024909C40|nr:tetratricopeptide repeat protein [Halomonas sp. A020]BCB60506.1 pellicle/biofilm biosynthesis protein PelB [Halomonas sp. A020]
MLTDKPATTARKGVALPSRRLIRPLTLRLIAAVVALILVLLFPAHHLLTLENNDSMPSRISILYAQALLNANPGNIELRISLANKLFQVGEFALANATLEPLHDSPDTAVQWLRLSIEWQLLAAIAPDHSDRLNAVQHFQHLLMAFQRHAVLSSDYLETMATYWLATEHPAHAAALYERLGEQDRERQYHWLSLAGHWWLRAGHPDRSAAAWHRAYQVAETSVMTLGWLGWLVSPAYAQAGEASPESLRRAAALEALRSAQQSQDDDGVGYAREYLSVFPNDPELLDLGIRLALAHGQPLQALAWSQRLIDVRPGTATLERHVTIALGLNELAVALEALTFLRQRHPEQPRYLEQFAQTQQWAGDAAGAMQSAQTLARLTGEERHDRWVVALALSVRDRNAALQALTRLESNGTITLEDRRLWADLLEQLGDPDTAIARIQSWQAAGIRDQALAIRAATWLEQTGRLDEADEAWTAITAQYGAQPAFVQAQSNVLAQNWRLDSAFDVLANAPSTPQDAATGYWQQRAALAWQLGDSAASLEAYTALFEQGALDADGTSRLIQTAADQQQLDLAMRVSEQRWTQAKDGDALIQMLYLAQRERQPALTQTLLAMADQAPEQFAQSPDYWGAVAQQAFLQRAPGEAMAAYQRALELSTDNPSLQAGMLYALAAAGESDVLRQRLVEWQPTAANTPAMMSAMAEGHRYLGNLDHALTWYAMASDARVLDDWQQLYYADALDQSGQHHVAFTRRIAALNQLSPGLMKDLDAPLSSEQRREQIQVMALVAQRQGPDSLHGWYRHIVTDAFATTPAQANDSEWLFDAQIALQRPLHARYLLLRAQALGYPSPPWQVLAVAMEKNDRDTLKQLLESDLGRTLSATDRLAIMRQLDRRQDARALAETLTQAGEDHRQDLVELAQDMPHRLSSSASYQRLGELEIAEQEAVYQLSGERFWGQLTLVQRQLDAPSNDVDSSGITDERGGELTLGWNGPRLDTQLNVGQLQTDRVNRTYGSATQRWQATSRLAGTLYGEISQTSEINERLRLLAIEDRVGAQLEWTPTARDTLTLNASHIDLRSRETRASLGEGYRVDAAWRHALIKGATRQLEISLLANHADYRVNDALPDDIQRRLAADTQATDLLTDTSSFMGVGVTLRRGNPYATSPTLASPMLEVGLEAGYRLPDNDIGLNARLAVGSRLFGNDALSLQLEADQGSGSEGDTSLGVSLTYHYFLGH